MPKQRERIFPLYEEVRRVTATLTDAQFGKAVRYALSRYYCGEDQEESDGVVALAAAMMLDQAARYDKYREQQKENGMNAKNAGKPKEAKGSQGKPREAKGSQGKPKEAISTHGGPRTPPSPSPSPSPDNNIICSKAVGLLNDLCGGSFRAETKGTQRLVAARLNEGYSWDDFELVIRHQCGQWMKDEKMRQYLRPETLFGNKFESYLSNARRSCPQDGGYTIAPLVDPWDEQMGEG